MNCDTWVLVSFYKRLLYRNFDPRLSKEGSLEKNLKLSLSLFFSLYFCFSITQKIKIQQFYADFSRFFLRTNSFSLSMAKMIKKKHYEISYRLGAIEKKFYLPVSGAMLAHGITMQLQTNLKLLKLPLKLPELLNLPEINY